MRCSCAAWGLRLRPSPASYCRTASAPRTRLSVQFLFLAADPGKAPPRRGARREAPPAVVAAGEGVLLNGPHPSRCEVRTERPTNASRSPCRHRRAHAPRRRHRTTSSRYFLYTPEMVNEQTPYYEKTGQNVFLRPGYTRSVRQVRFRLRRELAAVPLRMQRQEV